MKPVHLSIDFHSGVPIYLQIVEEIQRMVQAGEMVPGDQLPTVRQLAAEIRVNFNTVARAYRMLDESRLISTQQGRGTYILDQPGVELDRKIKAATLETQLNRALQNLLKQGFSQDEIMNELKKIVSQNRLEPEEDEE